jgi:hypothetical protein
MADVPMIEFAWSQTVMKLRTMSDSLHDSGSRSLAVSVRAHVPMFQMRAQGNQLDLGRRLRSCRSTKPLATCEKAIDVEIQRW